MGTERDSGSKLILGAVIAYRPGATALVLVVLLTLRRIATVQRYGHLFVPTFIHKRVLFVATI